MTRAGNHRQIVRAALIVVLFSCADARGEAYRDVASLSADKGRYIWSEILADTAAGDALAGRHDDLGLPPKDRDVLSAIFSAAGLKVCEQTIPPSHLLVTFRTIAQSHAEIIFAAADTAGPLSDIVWVTDSSFKQPVGEFWLGDVVAFNSTVTINGELGGSVLAIGGDVIVSEAATVRGGVVVIGGILRQRGDGKIYGQVFSPGGHRRPRLSVTRAWEFEDEEVQWAPAFSYDRVDGARLGGHIAYQKSAYTPHLSALAAYALASQTWQYRLGLRQRLLHSIDLELRGFVFRLTETDDEPWVGRHPNTLYALFAGSDYRDYYGSDGGELGVAYKYRERGILSVTYRNTDYRWMDAESNLWHIFRPDHNFRENFSTVPLDILKPWTVGRFEDRTSAVHLAVAVEPRESDEHPSRFQAAVKAQAEIAGGGLGGKFDYDRWQLSAIGVWNGEDIHRLTARLWYGKGRRDLPPNKLFYLGGVGSLPGYPQKAFVGSEAILTTVEYRFDYWPNQVFDGGIMLFFDFGRASFSDDFFDLTKFKSDVGVGLGIGEDIRLDVAKGLDNTDRDIRVSLRLQQTW
jgi:hypothetical protein